MNHDSLRPRIPDSEKKTFLECIDMVKLNGAFQFVAGESESDCAIFFIGDVDEIVSLTITELNMRDSCNQQDEYVKVS